MRDIFTPPFIYKHNMRLHLKLIFNVKPYKYLLGTLIILILLFLVSVLGSCSKDSKNSVVEANSGTPVGTWCATRIDGAIDANGNPLIITCDVSTWIFKGDGTYSWFLHAPPYYNLDYTGTYKYENEKITLTGPVAQLPADGYIPCTKGSSSFTFLDSDNDRWIYKLNNYNCNFHF